jgi:hypothetical protein
MLVAGTAITIISAAAVVVVVDLSESNFEPYKNRIVAACLSIYGQ